MSYVIEDPEQFLKEAYSYLNSKGQSIWDNNEKALQQLSGRGNERNTQLLSNRLKSDPEFAKQALSINPNVHFHEFSRDVRNNADVVKHAVSINAEHMRFAGQDAKSDPKLVKAFLSSTALSDHTYNAFISKPGDYISPEIASKLGVLDKLSQMKKREAQPQVKNEPQDALGLTNQRMKMK